MPGPEVPAVRPEHDDGASRHVLAGVVADALDDRDRAGVPHREALARGARAEELTAGRPVEHGVADEARVARVLGRRGDDDPPAGHRLPDVVVRLADEAELDSRREEGAEALPGGALEAGADTTRRGAGADGAGDRSSEARADRAVAVPDLEGRLDEPRSADRGFPLCVEHCAEPVAVVRHRFAGVPRRARAGAHEQAAQVERVGGGITGPPLAEQIGAADGLVEGAETQAREEAAHLESDEAEVRLDHLGRAGELLAQLGPLARDPHRARVEVTRSHHQAPLCEEERGAERELVRAEQRGDHDVAASLEAAVDAHPHAAPQAVRDERLLCLGEPELPRRASVLDRRERARAGAAVGSCDMDDVRACLRDTGRDHADARRRDELHRDVRVGVDLLQVEDELGEVLDRVDVVVRRRRDEGDAGRGAAQTGDLVGHLVRRDLAAFAGLRALGDLDLELVRRHRVRGCDAEPPRSDLLDLRVALVAVAGRVLAPLAGVRPRAEAVHRDRDRLVRLGGERAQRHRAA